MLVLQAQFHRILQEAGFGPGRDASGVSLGDPANAHASDLLLVSVHARGC